MEKYEVVDVYTRRVIGYTDEEGYDTFCDVVMKLNKRGLIAAGIYSSILGFKNKNLVYVGYRPGFHQK